MFLAFSYHSFTAYTKNNTFALNSTVLVRFIYDLIIHFYRLSIFVASWWNPKALLWIKGRKNILQKARNAMAQSGQSVIWMHCASLGEFEQGRPLFEKVLALHPGYKGIITFFSPSGYEATKSYGGADHIFYLPLGSATLARNFTDILHPSLVIWIKYDYWLHYLEYLHQKEVPVLLVSANFLPEFSFFKWYGLLQRRMLHYFTHIFVQTGSSQRLLQSIGISDGVTINGDTRFDRVIDIAERFAPLPAIDAFCSDSPVVVAGSTWIEDEEELAHYVNTHPEITFVIAPHEIDNLRISGIKELFKASICFSQFEEQRGRPGFVAAAVRLQYNTLIIDNIGMLSRLYQYGTTNYVGGGFGDDGVHNVLEAAVYGKPVVFGPVFNKFIEAIELLEEGGAFTVNNALELEALMNKLLNERKLYDEVSVAAKQYVYAKRGATGRILQYIQEKRLLTS